jgi:hypothetical protein
MSIETLREESKKTVRFPVAKVRITWTDPLIDLSISPDVTEDNRVSYPIQVADLVTEVPRKWFHTNNPDVILNGEFYPAPSTLLEARKSQMGWWGTQNSDSGGVFPPETAPVINVVFVKRLVESFAVSGDSAYGEYPVDFLVRLYYADSFDIEVPGEEVEVVGNTQMQYSAAFTKAYPTATRIELVVLKWSRPNKIVKIVEFYTTVVREYYPDDILLLNILQEFEGTEGTLPVGNISCNEMDISLQNITDQFFDNNTDSDIYTLVKRNRKIEPFIGFQYSTGEIEYVSKGLYWSGDWATSDISTGAQTTARDRMELLRRYDFPYESVFPDILTDVTIKNLMTAVLESVNTVMYDFYFDVSEMNPVYYVPRFQPDFFKNKTYFKVIQELSAASISYAYMDTLTQAESENLGALAKDILRVRDFKSVFPVEPAARELITITKDDYISSTQPANTDSMANTINVAYNVFTEDSEKPGEWDSEEFKITVSDADSISEYGVMNFEYGGGDLIQYQGLAQTIGDILLDSYKIPKRDIEINSFGDVTLSLSNQLVVPEYQKNGIDKRGIFAVTKLSLQYDGSFRMTISGTKLFDDIGLIIDETAAVYSLIIDETPPVYDLTINETVQL